MSDVREPQFDTSGKYLYFFASTDAGPVKDWFAQSNADMRSTSGIYLAVLQNDVPSPIARESDEEKPGAPARSRRRRREAGDRQGAVRGQARDREAGAETAARSRSASTSKGSSTASSTCRSAGDAENLQVGAAGQVYYLKTDGDTVFAQSLRPQHPQERRRPAVRRGLRRVRRREEAALSQRAELVDRADQPGDPAGGRAPRGGRHRGPHRSGRRVEADLRRGVADQPRLLLRPEHARRGLGEAEGEVRRVPAARHDARAS